MEDLQSILEKINREGVEKADAEAARIVAAAKEKAAAIVREAEEAAAKAKADAERESKSFAERGEAALRQAARDMLISVEGSVTALLTNILARNVDAALSDGATAASVAAAAIKDLSGPGEIAAGPKLASALQAQLAASGGFTVVTDEDAGTGFSVRLDGGRVEHSFKGDVVAAELAKRLRPELAKLLKG